MVLPELQRRNREFFPPNKKEWKTKMSYDFEKVFFISNFSFKTAYNISQPGYQFIDLGFAVELRFMHY